MVGRGLKVDKREGSPMRIYAERVNVGVKKPRKTKEVTRIGDWTDTVGNRRDDEG